MKIPLYLALFPSEFHTCGELPPKPAWMACHFSSGGIGLSNLPNKLPAGSLLILDDSVPFQDHDARLIFSQLSELVEKHQPDALLLDFQRPGNKNVQTLVEIVTEGLPCPVVVSACYGADLSCPVFLPPGPLYQPLEEYLKVYQHREIWLDAAPISGQMIVTEENARYLPVAYRTLPKSAHFDPALHCHYHIKSEENQIIFNFSRACANIADWLEEAGNLGVSHAVGLFTELRSLAY